MQSKLINHQQSQQLVSISLSEQMLVTYPNATEERAFLFEASFQGQMDMYSDVDTVANYLNAHEGWFCRCAQPMQVQPLGTNGYTINVGRFGSFGYEVEPKIAVMLNPPVDYVYQMHTVPVPNYDPPGYDVKYQAAMKLQEIDARNRQLKSSVFQKKGSVPNRITEVSWTLNLAVTVEFPKFIRKLPKSMIQSTGDRLLSQIVRQVSPRLTYKVQQDFHSSHDLPIPSKNSRQLDKLSKEKYAL